MFNRLFFLFFILIGCTTKNNNPQDLEKVNLNFQLKKIKTINLEGKDVSLSYTIQYPNSSLVYLTNINNESKLIIYSLDLDSFQLKTLLDITPDFQLEANAIDQENSKIYLFTGDELIVYDFNNKQLSRMPFGTLKNGFLSNLEPVRFYPYIKDDVLFMEYFPNIEETFKSKLFYRQPFQAAINLKDNKVQLLGMTYPQEYQKKCFGSNYIPDRIIGDNNKHIVSFPYNDSVYIYDEEGKLLETKFFGTKTKKQFQFIPYDELENLQREVFDQFLKDIPFYAFSKFFSFSKIYCRQLFWFNKENNKQESTFVFYDVNWNYLGEFHTEGTMFLFDCKKYGILRIKINNNNLEIYDVEF
jgi:hypothetical protein